MDNLSKEHRSICMSRIRAKDTRPEIIVRKIIHRLGYRFRLHRRDLPGCPDIVLTRHKKVVLVHGCFWHVHSCRHGKVLPKTNPSYWDKKREGNVLRDWKNVRELEKLGWRVLVVWECETKDLSQLEDLLRRFLNS
jgi:DNA mismatch endonuclease (patch repair protein)